MKFYIENRDEKESMLLVALPKTTESKSLFSSFSAQPENINNKRYVLRPGETKIFSLDDSYILGVEVL